MTASAQIKIEQEVPEQKLSEVVLSALEADPLVTLLKNDLREATSSERPLTIRHCLSPICFDYEDNRFQIDPYGIANFSFYGKKSWYFSQIACDGRLDSRLKHSEEVIKVTRRDLLAIFLQVARNAIHAYLNVNYNYALVAVSYQNVEAHSDILRQLHENSLSPQVSLHAAHIESRLLEALLRHSRLEESLKNSIALYIEAVGQSPVRLFESSPLSFPIRALLELPTDALLGPFDTAVVVAMENNPNLLVLKSIVGPRMPLSARQARNESVSGDNNQKLRNGISLRIRTFEERLLYKAMKIAFNNHSTTRDQISVLRNFLRNGTIMQFGHKAETVLDLLDSQAQIFRVKSDLIVMEFKQFRTIFDIFVLGGTLLSDLGIHVDLDDTIGISVSSSR